MTPLLLACSSGVSDVVQLLCDKKADIRKMSGGRGALQLASTTAGENNKLVQWLQWNYPDLEFRGPWGIAGPGKGRAKGGGKGFPRISLVRRR